MVAKVASLLPINSGDFSEPCRPWLTESVAAPAIFNYACDANADGFIGMPDLQALSENWP